MGFARGSRLQWPTVSKLEGQVFKLERVMYYVDPKSARSMGFLAVRERNRKPINSKHTSLEALESHIIELKAESEKRGLGSLIEIKLCRLEKPAEGCKAYTINNNNVDEINFLREVITCTRSRRTVKVNFETRESQKTFLLRTVMRQH